MSYIPNNDRNVIYIIKSNYTILYTHVYKRLTTYLTTFSGVYVIKSCIEYSHLHIGRVGGYPIVKYM